MSGRMKCMYNKKISKILLVKFLKNALLKCVCILRTDKLSSTGCMIENIWGHKAKILTAQCTLASISQEHHACLWPVLSIWIIACVSIINNHCWLFMFSAELISVVLTQFTYSTAAGTGAQELCDITKMWLCFTFCTCCASSLKRGQPHLNNQVWLVSNIPWLQLCCSRPEWQPAR